MSTKIKCPRCQKEVIWNKENLYRPFCSDRCKLIDLGDWAEENHKIPSDFIDNPDDFINSDSEYEH